MTTLAAHADFRNSGWTAIEKNGLSTSLLMVMATIAGLLVEGREIEPMFAQAPPDTKST